MNSLSAATFTEWVFWNTALRHGYPVEAWHILPPPCSDLTAAPSESTACATRSAKGTADLARFVLTDETGGPRFSHP